MLFSVIIPTKDRPASLERCLRALCAQDFPREDFEVIIIDDGSVVSLDSVTENHRHSLPLRLVSQPNQGPASARNHGLKLATGSYVIFTDDDCRPHKNWLKEMQRAFESDPQSAWGGCIEAAPENTIFGNASQLLVSYLYEHNSPELSFFCTNNLAFPRQALLALGGFDESFPFAAAEDRDICNRWAANNKLSFTSTAIILHHQMISFSDFCRQHYRYGCGASHFNTKRALRGQASLRVQPYRFYFQMIFYPWTTYAGLTALALSSLLILAQFANIVGFLHEQFKGGVSAGHRHPPLR